MDAKVIEIESLSLLKKTDSHTNTAKRVTFDDKIIKLETWSNEEYDRFPDRETTLNNITELTRTEIKIELNYFKRTEMAVHEESRNNTSFHH